jgi:hypothetical protein
MRFSTSVVLVLLAGVVAFAGGQSRRSKEPELITQSSAKGRYKAAFPGITGKPDARKVKTDAGEVLVTTESATASKDLTLAVTWTDYPEPFKSVPADKMLAAVAAGMKSPEAKLVSEKDIAEADPNPAGREVLYDYGKHRVRARLYVVGNRLYQVSATGSKTEVDGKLAGKFLASFEVTK